ncbi:hypothetical protein NKH34_14990 [Mesorhizobium sp. M1148]|uniref:hypothetical protein n=1 Tax=unclassified Mesorhizobium TaxID=325217 RepID=UPI0033387C42
MSAVALSTKNWDDGNLLFVRKAQNMKRTKTPRPIRAGYWLSGVWAIVVIGLLIISAGCPDVVGSWWDIYTRHLSCMQANTIGDFLAGAFAPLAFLWLVITVLVQSEELAAQREELELTRSEMTANRGVAEATRLAIEQQAQTAKASAEFVAKQTDIMVLQRETTQLELRAYLSVAPAGVTPMKGQEARFVGNVIVQNVGRLIASNVRLSVQMEISDRRNRSDFPVPEKERGGSIGVVHPTAIVRRGAKQPVPYSELESLTLASDLRFVFVWGAVWYDDGFGHERTSYFCHRYNVESGTGVQGTFQIAPEKARYQETANFAN